MVNLSFEVTECYSTVLMTIIVQNKLLDNQSPGTSNSLFSVIKHNFFYIMQGLFSIYFDPGSFFFYNLFT